ncbi:MAG: hypothetical protein HYZ88_03250 [Candidatus Omnitrophica bacterium]|nr:hypothetical protein [Candidatus Omnitrophota bacterium]
MERVVPGESDRPVFPREFFDTTLKELVSEYVKEDSEELPPRVVLYLSNGNTVMVQKIRALEQERMLVEGKDATSSFWTLISYRDITQVVLDSVEGEFRFELE